MDYDSISKGRRRSWDELKPDEVRRREKEEARERRKQEQLDEPDKLSYQEYRKLMKEQEEERDRRLFARARRQIIVLVSAFALALIGWLTVEGILDQRARSEQSDKLLAYQQDIRAGVRVHDLLDPTSAFASWRSAVLRREFRTLVNLYSDGYLGRATSGRQVRRETVAAELQRAAESGTLTTTFRIAAGFDNPEILRLPRAPWADKELALFRTSMPIVTQPVFPTGDHYVVAMAYDAKAREWRFADMRKSQFFSVRWVYETAIRSDMADGPRAIRYDEQGRPIEPRLE